MQTASEGAPVMQPADMLVDFRPPMAEEPIRVPNGTDRSPWQSFRYIDSGIEPGHRYRYRVIAQYGRSDKLKAGPAATVTVTSEDPARQQTAVYFNRAAASSQKYIELFGDIDPDELQPAAKREAALAWLSRGLEEGLLAFLTQAIGPGYALHVALYEFHKPRMLEALAAARQRGAQVKVVYHMDKPSEADRAHTGQRNEQAAAQAGLTSVCARRTRQGDISHNKFMVLLKHDIPQAVWTGSTNWTEGAIYGQLNVGHAIHDARVAEKYERYFDLLYSDTPRTDLVRELTGLNALPDSAPTASGIWPIFSPAPQKTEQDELRVIKLYADICRGAQCLLVCAPFALHSQLTRVLLESTPASDQKLRFMLLNMEGNLGVDQQVAVMDGQPGREVSVAVTLRSPLHDFQNRLLADTESFRHRGIHVHAKFIVADPLSDDPVIVTGSANFSANSTESNDENTLIMRGPAYRAIADIYTTEFFRMFDSYSFRGKQEQREAEGKRLALAADDSWTQRHYEPDEHGDTDRILSRQLFAGTLLRSPSEQASATSRE
ncbi:MAG: phospholipase D-like domain-containing protein [Anaerolineales bacterium]